MPHSKVPEPVQPRIHPVLVHGLHDRVFVPVHSALFFVLALAMNVIQALCLPVLMVSQHTYRQLMAFTVHSFAHVIQYYLEKRSGVQLWFYGSVDLFGKRVTENAVLISNHSSYADWPVFFMVAIRAHTVRYLRIFIKDLAKFIPGFGWGSWFVEMIFLRRNFNHDSKRISQVLHSFKSSGNSLWIALFPEGTFVDDKNLNAIPDAEMFAQSKGLAPFRHVLTPRIKGFHLTVQAVRDQATHVIDLTIAFVGCRSPDVPQYCTSAPLRDQQARELPGAIDFLRRDRAPREIHIYTEVFPIGDVPQELEDVEKWLFERFRRKDELLAHFHEHGAFPGQKQAIPWTSATTPLHFGLFASVGACTLYGLLSLPGVYFAIAAVGILGLGVMSAVSQRLAQSQ